MAISARAILKKINVPEGFTLEMQKGDGYWYFIGNSVDGSIYETKSVYCMFLVQMDIDRWVEDGQDFVDSLVVLKKKQDERRAENPFYHTMSSIYLNLSSRGDK